MDQLPRLGKRELVFLLLFTCRFVVSVLGRFLFLLVLGMDCAFFIVALPGPSINYFEKKYFKGLDHHAHVACINCTSYILLS